MTHDKQQLAAATSRLFPILGHPPHRSSGGQDTLHGSAGNRWLRRVAAVLVLLSGALVPAWLDLTASAVPPQSRDIHIEAYRYGFNPSRIHVNRGDRVRLTFSTRDTGQSFFLQDYDLQVAITPGDNAVLLQRPSRPNDPAERVPAVNLVAGLPGWQGWLFTKSTFRNHTYNGPLHGTERGDLIVGPNLLLHSSLGLLCALPVAWIILRRGPRAAESDSRLNLFRMLPWLKRAVKAPSFQFNLILPSLALFWFIILAGLLGTKVAGRNVAPMIVWVLWLSALIIVLVPVFGRLWCTVCPLPVIGEWWQRARIANHDGALSSTLKWPGWLSNAWPRVLLFLLLGTFSTTLVVLPPATSWMLVALAMMAMVLSFFPEQRLFCRYLCPINSYSSLYSTTGRVMVRAVAPEPCAGCREQFCLTGSAKGWGCPYGLCVGDLNRNNDCGACMECVKTCAYDNVAVFWRTSGRDTTIASNSEAWQAIVMFALACLYCYVNLGAWDSIRNWIDVVDRQNWHTFLIYAAVVWMVCLGVLPLVWYLLTRAGIAVARTAIDPGAQFRASTASLIPIGLGCWIAFALATLLPMLTFVLQSLSDPLNWGWNLLGMAGTPWYIPFSPAIPAMQVACILVGFAYSIDTLRECWSHDRASTTRALSGAIPAACFLWAASAGMIWFFAG